MGSALSAYKNRRRQRARRRQLRKNIFCVQKPRKDVLPPAVIPKVCPMVALKELEKELRSLDPDAAANSHGRFLYNEPFIEGKIRIPKASPMVVMKELGKELRSLYPNTDANSRCQMIHSDSSMSRHGEKNTPF